MTMGARRFSSSLCSRLRTARRGQAHRTVPALVCRMSGWKLMRRRHLFHWSNRLPSRSCKTASNSLSRHLPNHRPLRLNLMLTCRAWLQSLRWMSQHRLRRRNPCFQSLEALMGKIRMNLDDKLHATMVSTAHANEQAFHRVWDNVCDHVGIARTLVRIVAFSDASRQHMLRSLRTSV